MKYKEKIERLHQGYGERIWTILYQSDAHCRLEAVEPIKRQIASEQELLRKAHADSGAAGGPPTVPGYDPTRPWNSVFQRAVSDEAFWREEVVEPAYLVLTEISGLNEQVAGDAPIKSDTAPSPSVPQQLQPAQANMSQMAAPKLRPWHETRSGAHHRVEASNIGTWVSRTLGAGAATI